jgi:hypothetical protein
MYYLLRTPNSVSFNEIAPCWNEYLWRSCMSLKYILTMTHSYSAYLCFSGNKTKCLCLVVLKAPVTHSVQSFLFQLFLYCITVFSFLSCFYFRRISLLPAQSLASSDILEETSCQHREYRSVIELSVFKV